MRFHGLTQVFFNKWEVHQLLMKDESIMPLLPNTDKTFFTALRTSGTISRNV